MFRGILPKEVAFYDHFEKLAGLNLTISELFLTMVEGKINFQESLQEIKKLEEQTELTTRTSIDLIHQTFITPFNRDDIFYLLKGLDNFSDDIYAATFRLTFYEIKDIRPEAIDFAQIIYSCNIEIESAIKGLRKIKRKDGILKNCAKVHELEFLSDEILRNALIRLYNQNDVNLVIKWKEIFDRLERAVDRTEKVARLIERIVLVN
jgi:uncharacterized protein Yka (UPF0111/DUF47 family)